MSQCMHQYGAFNRVLRQHWHQCWPNANRARSPMLGKGQGAHEFRRLDAVCRPVASPQRPPVQRRRAPHWKRPLAATTDESQVAQALLSGARPAQY
ncbi:unnamed protein product, partial [Iphiclides podalirius]